MNRLDVLLHILLDLVLIEVLQSTVCSIAHVLLSGSALIRHEYVCSKLASLGCLTLVVFLLFSIQLLVAISTLSTLLLHLLHRIELLLMVVVDIEDVDD